MRRLLTVDQVSECLGVRSSTIRRWIHQRRVPVVKLGRAVRFREEDVERLIRDGLRPAIDPGNGQVPR